MFCRISIIVFADHAKFAASLTVCDASPQKLTDRFAGNLHRDGGLYQTLRPTGWRGLPPPLGFCQGSQNVIFLVNGASLWFVGELVSK